jgi:hypothetical protein
MLLYYTQSSAKTQLKAVAMVDAAARRVAAAKSAQLFPAPGALECGSHAAAFVDAAARRPANGACAST